MILQHRVGGAIAETIQVSLRFFLGGAIAIFLAPSIGNAQPFVGFDSFCGVPVIAAPTSQSALATVDQMGRKIIIVDPGVLANVTHDRMFVLAHECGHHVLGHITALGAMQRFFATKQQELDADCWAAQQLTGIMASADLRATLQDFASQGPVSFGGYPSGWERASHAAQCAGVAVTQSISQIPSPPKPPIATRCVVTFSFQCPMAIPKLVGQPCTCFGPQGQFPGVTQ